MIEQIGKLLIFIGIFTIVFGLLFVFLDKIPFNLGKLPGDIYIKRDNFVFYFPITTSIIISVFLSIIFYLISKLSK